MRIIALTTPKVTDDDAYIIKGLLDKGVDVIHLRKPMSNVEECRALLSTLDRDYRERIIVHDYPELYYEFSLKGIHVNRSVTRLPDGYDGFRSRSCHTFDEVARYKGDYDYLFISPIFDSISKVGYRSGFDGGELQRLSMEGVIDDRVVALGGVTLDRIAYLKSLHFGGVAMLGALYSVDAVDGLDDINRYR